MNFNKELKFNSLYLLVAFLLVSKVLFSNDSLKIKSKRFFFLNYLEFYCGINMNQGSTGKRYYEVNYRKTFRGNVNIITFKGLDVNFSANYIQKSVVGSPFNEARKYFFFGRIVASDYSPNRTNINFDLSYCSLDLRAKYSFLKTKKIQPFIEIGMRENILYKSGYNTSQRSDEIDEYIKPNLKNAYLNYLFCVGINFEIKKFNSFIIIEAELNNDQTYFTNWQNGRAKYLSQFFEEFYGGKFQSILFRIGLRKCLH